MSRAKIRQIFLPARLPGECSVLNVRNATCTVNLLIAWQAFNVVFLRSIELTPQFEDLEHRVLNLIDTVTYETFAYTSRALFEKDKLTFTALVCIIPKTGWQCRKKCLIKISLLYEFNRNYFFKAVCILQDTKQEVSTSIIIIRASKVIPAYLLVLPLNALLFAWLLSDINFKFIFLFVILYTKH